MVSRLYTLWTFTNEDIHYLAESFDQSAIYEYLREQLDGFYAGTVLNNIVPEKPNSTIFNEFTAMCYKFLTLDLPNQLQFSKLQKKFHPYIKQLFMDMISSHCSDEAIKLGDELLSKQAGSGATTPIISRWKWNAEMGWRENSSPNEERDDAENQRQDCIWCWNERLCSSERSACCHPQYGDNGRCGEARQISVHCQANTTAESNWRPCLHHRWSIRSISWSRDCEPEASHDTSGLLQGGEVLRNSYIALLVNDKLREQLYQILPSNVSEDSTVVESLWQLLLKKYLPVNNNTYRKRLLEALQKAKKTAHRVGIEAKSETSTSKRQKRKAAKVS